MAIKKLVSKFKKEAKEYKLEKRKLQALEKAAFIGEQNRQKQLKKLEKEKKQKDRAEAAVKKGIAKAQRKPSKEAAKFIKKAVVALTEEEKPKKRKAVCKKKTVKPARTPTEKFKSITVSGKRYTLNTVKPNKSMSDKTKMSLKSKGKLVRVVKRRDGYFIYTRNK